MSFATTFIVPLVFLVVPLTSISYFNSSPAFMLSTTKLLSLNSILLSSVATLYTSNPSFAFIFTFKLEMSFPDVFFIFRIYGYDIPERIPSTVLHIIINFNSTSAFLTLFEILFGCLFVTVSELAVPLKAILTSGEITFPTASSVTLTSNSIFCFLLTSSFSDILSKIFASLSL